MTGWGEATTIGGLSYGVESPEGIKLTIDRYLASLILDGAAMPAIHRRVKGNHHAKCAIETALLDATAKRAGLPLSELLGGRARDRLEIVWTLASGVTERGIDEAEEMPV